jgi:hypothetical protein
MSTDRKLFMNPYTSYSISKRNLKCFITEAEKSLGLSNTNRKRIQNPMEWEVISTGTADETV